MAKLGTPDCRWIKLPELDSFIASTIPKEVMRNDNTFQKTQRLWFEVSSVLAAIVDRSDADKILDGEIIQGIRSAQLLLGNASKQHSLQQRKAILQHLNPQLKSMVQDADFAEAPPYLFGTNFGELTKERLEAAALIQKTAQKALQNFQKLCIISRSATPRNSAPGAVGVAVRPPEAPAEEEVTLGVQEAIHPTTGVD